MEWLWATVLAVGLAGLAMLAWSLGILDIPGGVGAYAIGLLVIFIGGLGWIVLLSLFTIIGVITTLMGQRRKQAEGTAEARGGERGLPNVVANGAAPAIAVLALLIMEGPAPTLAFATAVAAVAADTSASELGSLSPRPRSVVPPFARVPPGHNGGASWLGHLAALAAASLIAAAAVPLIGLAWGLVWVPIVGGFVGCQLDSLLGATFEGNGPEPGVLGNEGVNFVASLIPTVVVLAVAGL